MKFQISSKDFASKVTAASKAIEKKNSISILANIMLGKDDEGFYIIGSSTNKSLTLRLGAIPDMCDTEFTPVCLSTQTLREVLVALPEQPLNVTISDNICVIEHSSGKFQMGAESAQDYPRIETGEVTVTEFNIESNIFTNAVKEASLHTSKDELHRVLGCVCVDLRSIGEEGANCMSVVGCDGQTLYQYDHTRKDAIASSDIRILLPVSVVSILSDAFANVGQITIRYCGDNIVFSASGRSLVATTPEGTYPNYLSIIPAQSTYSATINTKDFASAIKRVSLMSDGSQLIRMRFSSGAVVLSASDIDFAKSASDSVGVVDGNIPEGMVLGVKSGNLLKVMEVLKSENVIFGVTAKDHPFVFREDKENSCLRELVMPMRIDD